MTLTPKQLTLQAILHELPGMYWLDEACAYIYSPHPDRWYVVGRVRDHLETVTIPHSLGALPDTCSDRVAEALAPLLELRP